MWTAYVTTNKISATPSTGFWELIWFLSNNCLTAKLSLFSFNIHWPISAFQGSVLPLLLLITPAWVLVRPPTAPVPFAVKYSSTSSSAIALSVVGTKYYRMCSIHPLLNSLHWQFALVGWLHGLRFFLEYHSNRSKLLVHADLFLSPSFYKGVEFSPIDEKATCRCCWR